jgi:hypothetical protein
MKIEIKNRKEIKTMKLQQGDVILKSTIRKISGGKKLNHLILAEGEATGHRHEIVSGAAALIALQDTTILRVLSDYAKLKHAEHREIDIPKGKYEISIVREYDHFDEEARRVVD